MPNIADVQYFAERLKQNEAEMAPIRSKMYNEGCFLTYEEQFKLRSLLTQNHSITVLLTAALAEPDPVKPHWWSLIHN